MIWNWFPILHIYFPSYLICSNLSFTSLIHFHGLTLLFTTCSGSFNSVLIFSATLQSFLSSHFSLCPFILSCCFLTIKLGAPFSQGSCYELYCVFYKFRCSHATFQCDGIWPKIISKEPNHVGTLILVYQPAELWGNKFLLSTVKAPQVAQDRAHSLIINCGCQTEFSSRFCSKSFLEVCSSP